MEGADQESEPYESPNTIPVPAMNGTDLPLHSVTFRYVRMYEHVALLRAWTRAECQSLVKYVHVVLVI